MIRLSARVNAIQPSATLALSAKAKALAAQGVDIAGFTAGEPDFDTPEHIKEAAKEAIRRGFTKYTPTGGIPELKKAVVEKMLRDLALAFDPAQVLVSVGAKHSLYNLFQALLDPGDEVIVIAPYWVSYPDMVALAGGRAVIVETRPDDGYAPDPAALRRALTPRTRAIVINSPSNPTGAVYERGHLAAIADALRGHDCLVVSDDIYESLVYGGRKFTSLVHVAPDLAPRMVVVNGCSKAYAMTGWRIGYAAGPTPLIAAMQKVQDQSTSNPTSISQVAAVAALTGPTDDLARMVAEFDVRRKRLVAALNAIDGVTCPEPFGAFYVFPSVRALFGRRYKGAPVTSSVQMSEILLSDFRVAAVPGAPFGAEGHLRLSFATSMAVIEKGVARLAEFVKTLQ